MGSNRYAMVFACVMGALPCAGWADELPATRKGLWEFNRTVVDSAAPGTPTNLANTRCADPTADMKRLKASVTKSCTFAPTVKSGNTYTTNSECTVQGAVVKTKSVLTFESDSAYKADITATAGTRSSVEKLVAKRIGDC